MDARTPPLLLTPPRAAQAPPNTETPDGRPRRHARLNLGLPGGAEALPEGGGATNLLAPGVTTPSLALAAPPRRAVQTYQAPERPDIAELRPSAAALAQVSAVGLDPYASAAEVNAAHGTMVAQRLSEDSQSLPSVDEWRTSAVLRKFFWLCVRCSVTNGNAAASCRFCFDTRDAILQSTSVDEATALMANTQHTAYGRGLVRCAAARDPKPNAQRPTPQVLRPKPTWRLRLASPHSAARTQPRVMCAAPPALSTLTCSCCPSSSVVSSECMQKCGHLNPRHANVSCRFASPAVNPSCVRVPPQRLATLVTYSRSVPASTTTRSDPAPSASSQGYPRWCRRSTAVWR